MGSIVSDAENADYEELTLLIRSIESIGEEGCLCVDMYTHVEQL